jgi:hypothetical protein
MASKLHFIGDDNLGPRGGKLYCFHCPGCHYGHSFEVDAPNGAGWKWNGSLDRPTFTPSLLVNKDYPAQRCHSYVTDGRIQFLSDCFHALKGQTVDLPDWDDAAAERDD